MGVVRSREKCSQCEDIVKDQLQTWSVIVLVRTLTNLSAHITAPDTEIAESVTIITPDAPKPILISSHCRERLQLDVTSVIKTPCECDLWVVAGSR